jgi:hypothetical protein
VIAVRLAERFEAIRYRVLTLNKPAELLTRAERERPMVILVDADTVPPIPVMDQLAGNPATAHIPVISFAAAVDDAMQAALAGHRGGMLVSEAALLNHLPQLLDRALEIH